MKRLILIVILGFTSITAVARFGPVKDVGKIPGSALKWIHAAEPEFQKQKLDVNRYDVEVIEEDDSVAVMLLNLVHPEGVRGNPGPLPEYQVTLSKKDMKVMNTSYMK